MGKQNEHSEKAKLDRKSDNFLLRDTFSCSYTELL